jgi:hypothetical protein
MFSSQEEKQVYPWRHQALQTDQRPNPKKNMCMGPYGRADYNLPLYPLQSRLQHIYHGQPYARADFIPQSGTLDLASEAKFLVPDRGIQSTMMAKGCRTGPTGNIGWQTGTTALCHSRLCPPVRNYKFGYRIMLLTRKTLVHPARLPKKCGSILALSDRPCFRAVSFGLG